MIPLLAALLPALLAAAPPPPPEPRLVKLGRVLALEDARSTGRGALLALVSDPDRGVRRRAVLAAGRVADPALVPALVDRLTDPEAEVRQMAAFSLGLIADPRALAPLMSALADPEAVVRTRAAEALGRLADPKGAAAVAQHGLAILPKGAPLVTVRGDDPGSSADPWVELRMCLLALARAKDGPAARSLLLLDGRPRFDWWAAAYVASRLEDPALAPVLRAAAVSNDPLSRALAARGLGALLAKDGSLLDLLLTLTKDRQEAVAVAALRALAKVTDPRATAAAAAALDGRGPALQEEALRALATLPPDPSLRRRVVALVGSPDPGVRGAALATLAHLAPDEFALVLSGMDPDPQWSVRAAVAEALGDLGSEMSVGLLFGMLKEADPRVLPYVLEGLRKARGHDAVDTLKRHLTHPDPVVRATAAEQLTELKAQGLSAPLAEAYRAALADPVIDARVSLLGALAAQKDDPSRAVVREAAAKDPSRVVRMRAAAALKELGEKPPDPAPEPVLRPATDYRLAMAPYDPQPDVPLYTPRLFLHTRKGAIEIHLNVVEAPLASQVLLDLARQGYFNGLTFHRVVTGFVIQGGDPRGDGSGGPGFLVRDEIGERPFGRGAVGIALSGRDTGGSQIFITQAPTPHLDGVFSVVGWVVSGMDVVDAIRPGDVIERVETWTGR